jgi:hypothetical protein
VIIPDAILKQSHIGMVHFVVPVKPQGALDSRSIPRKDGCNVSLSRRSQQTSNTCEDVVEEWVQVNVILSPACTHHSIASVNVTSSAVAE